MSTEDLDEDYKGTGFAGRLGFGERPGLVVIDFCRAYLDPDAPLCAGVEDARASCVRVLAAARSADIAVIHTRVEYQPGGADGGVFFRKVAALECFVKGNPLAEPGRGLAPLDGEIVVTKQYASASFEANLFDLDAKYADVVSEQDTLDYLARLG